jgi:hypothetical protein
MIPRAVLLCGLLVSVTGPAASAQNQAAQNPHGPLAQPCAVCHSPEAWAPARISSAFDHAKLAKFPLEGAHASVGCRSCHTTLTFKGAQRECANCHEDPHRGELGNSCSRCHTVRNFIDRSAMTRAHQVTRFPLTGAHVAADCESCHTPTTAGQMTFTLRTVACNDCHQRDFQATRNPDHTAGNFPRDCIQCHSTVAWQTARFDHASSGFPLTGAHLPLSCAQCHGTSGFGALPTACVSCHQKDYGATTDPNHQQAQFSTDCSSCHTTVVWTTATYTDLDAQFFPIYSGAHAGRWTSCSTCHLNPSDYRQFDCLSCHRNAHAGKNYTSQQCYSCHRRGGGG